MFKNLAIQRRTTKENPIFLGPMFLHGNNDFECFDDYFSHLSAVFRKMKSQPVFGVDDEPALHGAASHAFPDSRKLHCVKHLKDNINLYLAVNTQTSVLSWPKGTD